MLTAAQVRETIQERGLAIHKAKGQNFLVDENTVRKILRLSEFSPVETVIEIGAGLGNITADIAERARQVYAVELDDGYCDFMMERFGAPCVTVQELRDAGKPIQGHIVIIRGSALSLNPGWIAEPHRGVVIYGNLPYCETTPILVHLLEHREHIDRMLLLVQKEVGERIVANPDTKNKAYGKLSVMVQTYFEPSLLMDISPTVFLPRPDVRSAFLSLVTRREPFGHLGKQVPDDFPDFLHKVVFQAFAKRRKMLRTLMPEGWTSLSAEQWDRVFVETGVEGSRRGESLSPRMFHQMALSLYTIVHGSESG